MQAVDELNHERTEKYFLDIYGQIDNEQIVWFNDMKKKYSDCVQYKGIIPFNESTNILKHYYALLFPTYYEGEGFAGTLIDAMSAGLPIIASDWKYNGEIINENCGRLFTTQNVDDLKKKILSISNINKLKQSCIREYAKYEPERAASVLFDRLR